MSSILITSILAGGGHIAAMHALKRAFVEIGAQDSVHTFESSLKHIDRSHRFLNTKLPQFYQFCYDSMCASSGFRQCYHVLSHFSLKPIEDELMHYLENRSFDLVISTHFMQTYALLKIRHKKRAHFLIGSYIPDFDANPILFPHYKNKYPDIGIAQSLDFLNTLCRHTSLKPEQTALKAGFLPRIEFSLCELTKIQARQELLSQLPKHTHLSTYQIDPNKTTIIVTGGSFWSALIFNSIQEIAQTESIDWARTQILIACGYNQHAVLQYNNLAQSLQKPIIPLGFLSAPLMALFMRSADITVLSGLAPATLYELLESQAGPILVHRANAGAEKFNLTHFQKQKLVEYVPLVSDLITRLSLWTTQKDTLEIETRLFLTRAIQEKKEAHARALKVAKTLLNQIKTT